MAADIEVESFVVNGTGESADVFGVALQDDERVGPVSIAGTPQSVPPVQRQ
jgi:hypothetical protein